MHRRRWLKLGVGAAAVLAVGGGAIALVEPGLRNGKLATAGRLVFLHVGRAFLDGSLPSDEVQQAAAMQTFLQCTDNLVAGLPGHAQEELSQLLALLATAPGRRVLGGIAPEWAAASIADVQSGLQSMRTSSLALRQQAYHALHDITGGAYFSDPSTWSQLGYPGPVHV
jgi:hypothetical protein